ncbi:LOW QUALITY PROTEIN: nidogen-1-like [Acanthaster planci]|uniref:LOW QUALITY PROTEIN: nidogen-1-like n=1 Tax=Acanthaster planci TaxID=133434 RepID=A0A8B7XKB1_ACAPL|nr:LOW QUALITY PROTEIN: nidogen-1-like [Acanthaster planci]
MGRFCTSPILLWTAILSVILSATGLTRDNFYPFGVQYGDGQLAAGDAVQGTLRLRIPLQFLNVEHDTVYVNTDGLVTFAPVPVEGQAPYTFGVSLKNSQVETIAPFGADYNTSEGGTVFYREAFRTEVLNRASRDVSQFFGRTGFQARSLTLATWDSLRFKDEGKTVTFQLVIPSDGDQTFVFFIYDDTNRAATNDYRVVGFSNGEGSHLTIGGHVSSFTNVGKSGMWAWQVGGANLGTRGFAKPIIDSQGSVINTGASGSASGGVVSGGATGGGGSSTFTLQGGGSTGGSAGGSDGQGAGGSTDGGGGSSFTIVVGDGTGKATSVTRGSSSSSSATVVTVGGGSVDVGAGGEATGGQVGGGGADGSQPSTGGGAGAGRFDVDFNVGEGLSPDSGAVCDTCHPQATCQKFSDGYCCVCPPTLFGNGQACLDPQGRQRLNGLVSGTVNGQSFSNANLHSFIILSEARTYTAVSPLPPEISYSLQTITPMAEIMGWLFALPSGKGLNGFMLTGGKFRQTLNITFSTGEQMLITQEFQGVDEDGYIRVIANWNGNVPEILPSDYIFVDDHKEEYSRHRIGLIHTFAKRTMQVNDDTISFTMDQTIEYDECVADEEDTEYILNFMRVSLTETYLTYEDGEKILRFSMIGKVTPASEQIDDRCLNNNCDRNAQCLPVGESGYRCKCNPGYEGDGQRCTLSDPCAQNTCDINGYCIPQLDRYTCACNAGYQGDGFTCRVDRCASNRCDPNARCVETTTGYECYCNSGFTGDGFRCQVRSPCDNNACDVNAYCVPAQTGYQCYCNEGYTGNGFNCEAEVRNPCDNNACDVNAYCVPTQTGYQCYCNEGYTGDGYNCQERIVNPCDNNACDVNARCLPSQSGTYQCLCNQGFVGNGFSCQEDQIDHNNECDANARCVTAAFGYQCFCNPGFRGDGYRCQANVTDPCANHTCHKNARCGPSSEEGTYECFCIEGYTGDGFTCEVDPTNPCANNTCDSNARCVASSPDAYECLCNEGYTGDGFTCEADRTDPCADNTCDRNAQCVASSQDTYECSCNEGYTGDGFTCEAIQVDRCSNNACDANAQCFPSETGYSCYCNEGFSGDGFVCQEVVDPCANNNCDANAQCVPSQGGYQCYCNQGFTGDGFTCEAIVDYRCRNNRCSVNARCFPTRTSYRCYCNAGYIGNGFTCRAVAVDPCSNNRCDFNAECSPAPGGGYTCECNQGWEGDGFTCRNILVNLCSACDVSAQCIPEGRGFRCVCNSGFEGNGLTCEDVDECSQSGTPCHRFATCYNVRGSFSCYCQPGYEGDGFSCQEIVQPPLDEGALMYARGMAVMRVPLNPNQPGSKVIFRSGQTIVGLGYDCSEEYIYWTDVSGRTISRAKADGSSIQVLINRGLSSPEGLAVDWLSRNMYWTDSGYDRIEVANLDGSNRRVLLNTNMVNPRAIAADPIGGFLYWTDWNRDGPKIERSNMDGSERTVLVDTNLGLPNGLSLDYTTSQICWVDAGTKRIECMNMNGDPLTRFTVFPNSNYPFSIASYGFKLYWSDWETKSIQSISKTGGAESTQLKLPRGGNGRIYSVVAVTSCPSASNACTTNNGGCSSLCLPLPGGLRKCACPTNLEGNEVPCV